MSNTIQGFNQGALLLNRGATLRVDKDGGNLHEVTGFEKISLAFQRKVMGRSAEALGTDDASIAKAMAGLYRSEHGGSTRLEVARQLDKLGLGSLAKHLEASPSLQQRAVEQRGDTEEIYATLDDLHKQMAVAAEPTHVSLGELRLQMQEQQKRKEVEAEPTHVSLDDLRRQMQAAKNPAAGHASGAANQAPVLPPKGEKALAQQRIANANRALQQTQTTPSRSAGGAAAAGKTAPAGQTAATGKSNSAASSALFQDIRSPGFPAHQFGERIKPALSERLGQAKTDALMKNSSDFYLHLGAGARYKDIGVPKHSAVQLGDGRTFHASHMPSFGRLSDTTIATQAPMRGTMKDFVQMTQEQGISTIIDLTNPNDKSTRDIPDYGRDPSHGFSSQDRGTANLKALSIDKRELRAADNPQANSITYLNFAAWPDKQPIPAGQFKSLISAIAAEHGNKPGGITVHCTAGVGRTGTVMAGLELNRMAQAGELTQNNFMEKVLDVVAQGREARGHAFVQTAQQLNMLYEFAQSVAR